MRSQELRADDSRSKEVNQSRPRVEFTSEPLAGDKLLRRDRLSFVTSPRERCEMSVLSDQEICASRDRTVGENVVIRVSSDDVKMEGWSDAKKIVACQFSQINQAGQLPPTARPA